MTDGRYIVFEGPDLVGKTTMANMAREWLAKEYEIDSIYAQQPGSTNLGRQLRHIIKHEQRIEIGRETEALVFVLDQMAFVENMALGAIDGGKWIISDRNNNISGLVYQVLNGVDPSRLNEFYSIVPTPKIDLIFVLQADSSIMVSRAKERGDEEWDRYESNADFMRRVYAAYDNLLESHRDRIADISKSCIYVDANRGIQEVFVDIKDYLAKLL